MTIDNIACIKMFDDIKFRLLTKKINNKTILKELLISFEYYQRPDDITLLIF